MPLLRLARTLAHLRPRQFIGQARQRRLVAGRAGSWPGVREGAGQLALLPPPAGGNSAEALLSGRFSFVGEERALGFPPEWQPAAPKLWLYNLHYFDWLWLLPPEEGLRAMLDWIARHPLRHRAVGWEPYPTSLRLANWSALLAHHCDAIKAGDLQAIWESLVAQARWLQWRLETHLLGNHLLENGLALALAGSVLAGPEAARWREAGWRVLDRELPEQFPPDGLHFERSPMYQLRLLHAVGWLASASEGRRRERLEALSARMRRALACLVHPDGGIALLQDAAHDVYHAPGLLLGDEPLPPGAWSLPDAGYFGARTARGDYVVVDAGSIGPAYIPGHAHAGMLSLELSLVGRRIVSDSGVSSYVPGAERDYCRSTTAHNTVEIEGRDQAELWGAFRVGQRGRIVGRKWSPGPGGGFVLEAAHDGYRHLPGGPMHRRRLRWAPEGVLEIEDEVASGVAVGMAGRLHFHPECRLEAAGEGRWRVEREGVVAIVTINGPVEVTLEESWECPRFEERVARPCLVTRGRGGRVAWRTRIEGERRG